MTTEFHVLKILSFVNIQVELASVMVTQDLVRVNSQGCNGESLGSDRTRITQFGALNGDLADVSIPPIGEG